MYALRRLLLACCAIVCCAPAFGALPPVRVGMGLTKPPYVFESGREGIEVEIAREAFAAAGFDMSGLQFPPARGLGLLRAGQLDALLTVDEGIGDGYFSETYVVYHNVAVTLARRHIPLKHIDDLPDYSVAGFQNASVTLGPHFHDVAQRHPQYREYAQQITQAKLLFTGRVDVVVGDRLIFRYFAAHMDGGIDGGQPVVFHDIFPPSPRKVAFRDPALRDRFNAGLRAIRQNGIYDAILKKYHAHARP
ncbi:transporter substrate-binding domain-containing protein [Oxalobacteraceae bacterium OM1]|nr:transporter substrate-binding domain-containing protein [Oxalobacteraceae bacterium OM1]